MLKDLDRCPSGFTYSLGLSLHLKPLILWNSLVLLLKVPNKGLTLSSGPERHILGLSSRTGEGPFCCRLDQTGMASMICYV